MAKGRDGQNYFEEQALRGAGTPRGSRRAPGRTKSNQQEEKGREGVFAVLWTWKVPRERKQGE